MRPEPPRLSARVGEKSGHSELSLTSASDRRGGPRLSPKTFARPQTVVRTGRRVSHAGCARLRRSNQRMELMALWATAHPPTR